MKDARCVLGRHTGQENGGTMMFTCPRCRGSYMQPLDFSHVATEADTMIAQGDVSGALRMVRSAVRAKLGA